MKAEITSPFEFGQTVYFIQGHKIIDGVIVGIQGSIEDFNYEHRNIQLRVEIGRRNEVAGKVNCIGYEWKNSFDLFADRNELIQKLTA